MPQGLETFTRTRTPPDGGEAADQHRRPGPMLHRRRGAAGRAERVRDRGSRARPGGEQCRPPEMSRYVTRGWFLRGGVRRDEE